MNVPFNDFKLHYKQVQQQVANATQRVLESGWYVLGNEVASFEKEFASFLNASYSVGVASGTEAITLSLMAYDIGVGDEVITTSLTAYPTITAITQAGAKPVVVDVFEKDGLIDYTQISAKITSKTKAIIPVHLFGQSCDMDALQKIAQHHHLLIIEDCAQAVGTTYKNKFCGTIGNCGAFSFYPTKNLGAFGDAGAVVTNCEKTYHKLMSLRNYGQTKRYHHEYKGINSRLDELQAAILREKLPFLKQWNEKRAALANVYRTSLKNVSFIEENDYGASANHLFVIKSEKREELLAHLNAKGIGSLIHYPIPIHKQKAFEYQKNETLPVVETLTDKILSLPIYPELSTEKQQYIIETINNYAQ